MFHNIFEKLKIRKRKKQKPRPRIIADMHEKNSLVLSELKSNKDIDLEIKSIKIGDYLIGATIIERKTTSDFIGSMINKRLTEQLRQMSSYKKRLLIIEGKTKELFKNDTNMNPNAVRGFILSIISNYETPIIFTKNHKETSKYLVLIAKQQLKPKTEMSLHSRIPKTIKEQKQYILEAFPNIGPKKAKKLLEKFKNLEKTFNASEEELRDVLKNKSREFKRIINS